MNFVTGEYGESLLRGDLRNIYNTLMTNCSLEGAELLYGKPMEYLSSALFYRLRLCLERIKTSEIPGPD